MIIIIKQSCHIRERERGPDDSDEEDHGRLLTFPHPISITIPYLRYLVVGKSED